MKRAAFAVMLFGCSLGLDPSKLVEAGPDVQPIPEAGPDGPPPPNPAKCKADNECTPNNACLKGTCDALRGVCLYEVCPQSSMCQIAACDDVTSMCGMPQTAGFHVASFKVGNIGCSGNNRRCFAAVHPFVFVGTTSGVVAYAMATANKPPAAIPVGGVPFLPSFVVSAGKRVYFVGAVVGATPNFRVPIAWLEVPGDPTVKSVTAQTAFLSSTTGAIDRVYGTDDGSIYLVTETPQSSFATARATAPLVDLGDLQFFPNPNVPNGSGSIASSGTRLLFGRAATSPIPHPIFFDFENGAGTSMASNSGEMNVTMAAGNDTTTPHAFARGPDGMIVWQAATADFAMMPYYLKGTRLVWIVPSKMGTLEPMIRTDIESYDTMLMLGLNSDVVGPIAVVDQDRVLVLGAASQTTSNTSVKLATKSPMPSVVMGKNFVFPFAPSALAAESSGGWGYVLTPEPSPNAGPQVHVFAPDCN